jgi:uncharacterized protein (TIGR03435 family)
MTATLLADHVWQSTLVAGVAWLMTLVLRRNSAGARYAVWLAASLKFLVPFALIVNAGSYLGWRTAPIVAPPQVGFVMESIGQPFSASPAGAMLAVAPSPRFAPGLTSVLIPAVSVWLLGVAAVLLTWLVRWRRVAAVVRAGTLAVEGPVFDALRYLEAVGAVRKPLALLVSDTLIEPGVFGIRKPALLWPRQMSEHLAQTQIEAILVHEMAHVHRRDNLASALHMVVQAVFWFHPLVWWLGARLVDERERACDEEVVRLGSDPRTYAESILKICQFFVESPLVCVAGVTGSDLKKRIEHIMTGDSGVSLSAWKKTLLAIAAAATVAVPFVVGVLNAPTLRAQTNAAATSARLQVAVGGLALARRRAQEVLGGGPRPAFDATVVKPNYSGDGRITMLPAVGRGWSATNVTVGMLTRIAYQLQDSQIVGGPNWLFSDRFDVTGTGAGPGADGSFWLKLQALLADRFGLVVHNETKELPVYRLVIVKRESNLRPSTADCPAPPSAARGNSLLPRPMPPGQMQQCGVSMGPGRIAGSHLSMAQLSNNLSRLVGSMVVDRTNLDGYFDVALEYAPDPNIGGRTDFQGLPPPLAPGRPPVAGPSIFAALPEQLGLKLESANEPVEVLVIDSAQKPVTD